MKVSEARKLIGKTVRFKSNRTRGYWEDTRTGMIRDVVRREVYANGDWHDLKTFEVVEELPDKEHLG